MPDTTTRRPPPPDWGTALARLPDQTPPRDGWQRVVAALELRAGAPRAAPPRAGRMPRPVAWLAMAATLALAVALPWRAMQPDTSPPPDGGVAAPAPTPLADLYLESARLEVLLAHARDDRMSTGTAAAMASRLDARLAAIDAGLVRPGLAPDEERALWQSRVDVLRQLVEFEGTRRWLAANGDAYDGALARVD